MTSRCTCGATPAGPYKDGPGEIGYPVACSPQAWAAATPLALLQSCLGLSLDHERGEMRFDQPILPDFIDSLTLRDLKLGAASVDLQLNRHGTDVAITVLERRGDVRIVEVR